MALASPDWPAPRKQRAPTRQTWETRDLDESTLLDVDEDGHILGIALEHASQRAEIPRFSFEQVPA